jgi:predicted SnoaL-like aldol condensation-catalyzing enzyme
MTDLEDNKQTVIAFYKRAFNEKQPADAVAQYVGSQYVQHNPDTPDGADAFIQSMTDLTTKFPQSFVEIKRVIGEGDLVVTHNIVKMTPQDRGLAGVDIFRLREGKIVEHWDVRQPIPEKPMNDNTMF